MPLRSGGFSYSIDFASAFCAGAAGHRSSALSNRIFQDHSRKNFAHLDQCFLFVGAAAGPSLQVNNYGVSKQAGSLDVESQVVFHLSRGQDSEAIQDFAARGQKQIVQIPSSAFSQLRQVAIRFFWTSLDTRSLKLRSLSGPKGLMPISQKSPDIVSSCTVVSIVSPE